MPRSFINHVTGEATQPRSIVHRRVLEVATELARQANAWKPTKDMLTGLLGVNDGLDARVEEQRDGGGLELRTHKGRVRVRGKVRVEPVGEDRSNVSIDVSIGPAGITGRFLWWLAERTKLFEEGDTFSEPVPDEVIQLLGVSEAEWAEVRADLPKLFSGTLAAQATDEPPPRDEDPYPYDPDERYTPFDERNLPA